MNRLFVMALLTFALAVGITACGSLNEDVLTIRTADQGLTLHFRLLQPPAPPIEPAVLPTITPTPCHTIAGNINSQGKKLWHDESSPQWSQIVIDESKGERWFCSPEEAEAAGWTKAGGQ